MTTTWFCQDCAIKAINDEDPTEPTEFVPLRLITPNEIVTMDYDESDGMRDFDNTRCYACGTCDYGYRLRFAITTR